MFYSELLRQALDTIAAEDIHSAFFNPEGVHLFLHDDISLFLTYDIDGYIELRCKVDGEWEEGTYLGDDLQTLIIDAFARIDTERN